MNEDFEQTRAQQIADAEIVWAQIQDLAPEAAQKIIAAAILKSIAPQIEALTLSAAQRAWTQFKYAQGYTSREDERQTESIKVIRRALALKLGIRE